MVNELILASISLFAKFGRTKILLLALTVSFCRKILVYSPAERHYFKSSENFYSVSQIQILRKPLSYFFAFFFLFPPRAITASHTFPAPST